MSFSLLPTPIMQFADANGIPYAGASLACYEVGTFTPQSTYQDMNGTILNTNPIILDSAGRAPPMFGSGVYRCILTDSLGNLIWDAVTEAFLPASAISPTVLACLGSATWATFRDCSGITAAIQAAVAAIDLMPGPKGDKGDQGIQGIQGPAGPTGEAGAVSANVQGGVAFIHGGRCRVNFPVPFATACDSIVCMLGGTAAFVSFTLSGTPDRTGADILMTVGGTGTPAIEGGFYWVAVGH